MPGIRLLRVRLNNYWGYTANIRVYKPYEGDGLPMRAVWKREDRHIYLRCSGCLTINKNTANLFAKSRSRLLKPCIRRLRTSNLAVLYRCISCRQCRRSLSGTVLLGFNKPLCFFPRKKSRRRA